MNAVTATRPAEAQAKPLPPAEVFRHQLNNLGGELQSVLPRHISVDRFKRVVMTAVQQTMLIFCRYLRPSKEEFRMGESLF